MNARLELADGTTFTGEPFGFGASAAGEVVFNTGMVGYPESLTDPSYHGQILILTYPIIGNYGVPGDSVKDGMGEFFESSRIHVSALVVSSFSSSFSHWNAQTSLDGWLKTHRVPAIAGVDTRVLTQKLRQRGSMLGKLVRDDEEIGFHDPNRDNLVSRVSVTEPVQYGEGKKRVVLVDCGCKNGILRALLSRHLRVTVVPWDWPVDRETADGIVVSNGPGDPKH